MPGIHLISEAGFSCQFSKDYKFTGIPQYMMFDPEGAIIGTSLERPSWLMHIKFLDKHLDDPKWERVTKKGQ